MNISNPNDESDDEQNSNQQPTGGQQSNGQPTGGQPTGGQPIQGPEAASRRDVQEAEAKAEDAQQHAEAIHAELRAEIDALQEEVETLRSLSATHAVSLEYLFGNAGGVGFSSLKRDYEVPEPLSEEVAEMKAGDSSD